MHVLARIGAAITALAIPLLGAAVAPTVYAAGVTTSPPASFKKLSSLVKVPDFVPGVGTLYVDPATLPIGPFLGYDHQGKLVNIIYMVPLKDLDALKNWSDLGGVATGIKLDHTDVRYNPGHPGIEEPHYHIVEWLIGPTAVRALQ